MAGRNHLTIAPPRTVRRLVAALQPPAQRRSARAMRGTIAGIAPAAVLLWASEARTSPRAADHDVPERISLPIATPGPDPRYLEWATVPLHVDGNALARDVTPRRLADVRSTVPLGLDLTRQRAAEQRARNAEPVARDMGARVDELADREPLR